MIRAILLGIFIAAIVAACVAPGCDANAVHAMKAAAEKWQRFDRIGMASFDPLTTVDIFKDNQTMKCYAIYSRRADGSYDLSVASLGEVPC